MTPISLDLIELMTAGLLLAAVVPVFGNVARSTSGGSVSGKETS